MTKIASTEGPQEQEDGNNDLPAHLSEFLRLTQALDEIMKEKDRDPVEITRARAELSEFYGRLDPDKRVDIEQYVQRERVGRVIEAERGQFNDRVARAMHWPARVVRAGVEPVARLSGETTRLVAMTLGLTVRGAWTGLHDAFRKAA
jgi:hypothetical protein